MLDVGPAQSLVRPDGLVLTHAAPWLPLPWHTPVQGLAGVPAHAGPEIEPLRQIGHGCEAFAVTTVRAVSWMFKVAAPVDVSRLPDTGLLNVFSVQTESPAFGTGSGVPNRHPVLLQS